MFKKTVRNKNKMCIEFQYEICIQHSILSVHYIRVLIQDFVESRPKTHKAQKCQKIEIVDNL